VPHHAAPRKRRDKRLYHLFERAAADLAAVEGRTDASVVRCPLCLQEFDREAIALRTLTEEHIVPQAAGGQRWFVTITCHECNTDRGAKLDHHVVEAARTRDFEVGHGTRRTTWDIDGVTLQTNFLWNPDPAVTNEIRIVPQANDPRRVAAALDRLMGGAEEIKATIDYGYSPNGLRLGLLRSAYLSIFHRLGFSYVLSPAVAPVRRQITGADAPSGLLEKLVTSSPGASLQLRRSGVVALDLGPTLSYPAYLVLLQTKVIRATLHSVLLPHAGPSEGEPFEQLAQVAAELQGRTLRYSNGIFQIGSHRRAASERTEDV
jgi:hypothetical protein